MDAVTALPHATVAVRVRQLDWPRIQTGLDAQGFARIDGLLSARECTALAALYADDARFRSRVVMQRHGFGRGQYGYFACIRICTVTRCFRCRWRSCCPRRDTISRAASSS